MPIAFERVKGMKRPNSPVQFTPELVREYAKCAKDIYYFAEKYYTIIEENNGKHTIKLFDYQKKFLDMFVNNRLNVVNSGRQLGKCVQMDTIVEILDKSTGKIDKTTIKDFFDKINSIP